MPSSLFFPLDQIRPTQILAQYSEWIYFALTLVFFISIAGIALRKHFDRPYVKPLIISVGLMLTVGVFLYKDWLKAIFEGWGLLGTVLLFAMAGSIPYGLCRGFGMPSRKAFYLSYIILYLISWLKFSMFFNYLASENFGLVNLGLLILFIFSVFKLVKFKNPVPAALAKGLVGEGGFVPEIDRERTIQRQEEKMIKGKTQEMTRMEMKSVEDIAELLANIQRTIEIHKDNLPRQEREKIARLLFEMSRKEDLLRKGALGVQKILQGIRTMEEAELQKQKGRLEKVEGREKEILKAEIATEEEKIRIHKRILVLEEKLTQLIGAFKRLVGVSVDLIRSSAHPYDAKDNIVNARMALKDISEGLKEMKALEEKLAQLANMEVKLLKKEKKIA